VGFIYHIFLSEIAVGVHLFWAKSFLIRDSLIYFGRKVSVYSPKPLVSSTQQSGMTEPSSSNGTDRTLLFEARDVKTLAALLASGEMNVQLDFGTSADGQIKYGLLSWACVFEWAEGIALLMTHDANPDLVDLGMDSVLSPREILKSKFKDLPSDDYQQLHSLEYMLALIGGAPGTKFRVDKPFTRIPSSRSHMSALLYAAQEGYLHGAELLVEKYDADPLLSFPVHDVDDILLKRKREGHECTPGLSAMDYALKTYHEAVLSNGTEEDSEAVEKKKERVEQLYALMEYLRDFERHFFTKSEMEDFAANKHTCGSSSFSP